jgi:rhamnulokinase
MPHRIIALDLGASSGRAILGTLDGTLTFEEVHRFPNGGIEQDGRMRWDFDALWREIQEGIRKATALSDGPIDSIGIDTWGVDYGLLDADGELLEPPVHYRDARTNGMMDAAFEVTPRAEIFQSTGLQFIQLNTIFQLFAEARSGSGLLEKADKLLMIPDVFTYFLTGVKKAEFTDVSTTQCYDPVARDWARPLLTKLGIPTHMLPEIIPPGTVLGPVRDELAAKLGVEGVQVIASASHDTASAVAAVPAEGGQDWAYLSSGTWSLMGTELPEALINDRVAECNFTNEGGVEGTFRFLKNIAGLFLLQETMRIWREDDGLDLSWGDAVSMAEGAPAFVSWVNCDDEAFISPPDMPEAIRQFCRDTDQVVPEDNAALLRCIFESLAMKYRFVFDMLKELHPSPINVLHIVGGGSANTLLNQMTANALGVKVVAGPTEATAIGNLLVQAMALGVLDGLDDIRAVVRKSFPLETYEPADIAAWNDAYGRYREAVGI